MDSLVGLIMAYGLVSAVVAIIALWTQRDADRERERDPKAGIKPDRNPRR